MSLTELNLNLIQDLTSKKVKLEDLYVNPNNPRIMGKNRVQSILDKRIIEDGVQNKIRDLMKKEGLNDLIEKIKKVGFLPIDRIVVRPIKDLENKFVVLEGNRRVSTLKLLTKEHEDGDITLNEKLLNSIKEIEILVYTGKDKNIEWLLQGLRHINGVKEWGSLQQSRFLFEMQEKRKLSPTDLNKMTGLGRNIIANMIRSYKGWLVSTEIYDGDIKEEHFSLFREAIFARPKIKEWLEWDDNSGEFKNEDNLFLILNWFIGDLEGKRRFKRALDLRDVMSKILLKENKSLFDKFLNEEEYSVDEVKYDLNQKIAEKESQKKQLDVNSRLEEINDFNDKISTLPIKRITENSETLSEFTGILEELLGNVEFQLNLLRKYED